jgi:hypothetical protein
VSLHLLALGACVSDDGSLPGALVTERDAAVSDAWVDARGLTLRQRPRTSS